MRSSSGNPLQLRANIAFEESNHSRLVETEALLSGAPQVLLLFQEDFGEINAGTLTE